MNIKNLETPCIVVNLDILEKNISNMQQLANSKGVELWPMIKTHKSQFIVKKQLQEGAIGVLTAKLGEAEVMAEAGVKKIMLAYPIIGEGKLNRLCNLAKKIHVYCSVDIMEAAQILNSKGKEEGIIFDTIIIIDSGLKRLGIPPEKTKDFYYKVKEFTNLNIVGVATHGGHVYGSRNLEEVKIAAKQEVTAIRTAAKALEEEGVKVQVAALGSTPTVGNIEDFEGIKQIRPGNYVFHDAIQMALGIVNQQECALSVHATILSIPEKGRAVMDAGSKILCLDAGAHGNDNIKGFGIVKGYPDILIKGLSEELGRLEFDPEKVKLEVGQVIEIIPNHACTVVNTMDKLMGIRNGQLEVEIDVAARGRVY